ncbi:MAG: dihydrolipoamide succinyltransferase, partial [Cytophagales bacterium CG18_big_fil_WC_8_21_14_2_50_42_9]
MGLEVKVPVVGESITEVTIAKWLKKDGDQVAMDEVICELESDKATFELPAEGAGILKIRVPEGETIPVGTVLCEISGDGAATASPTAPAPAAAPEANTQSGYGGSGQPTSTAPTAEKVAGAASGQATAGAGETKEIK